MGGTENLRNRVDPQPPFSPDQLVVGGVLGLDALGHRELFGARRQVGEGCLPAARIP